MRAPTWWITAAVSLAIMSIAPAGLSSTGVMQVTTNTVLTEDHIGSIVIAADGVTLDCKGHRVSAPPDGAEVGITIDGRTGVTVANCVVTGFARNGIVLRGASHNVLVGNVARRNGRNGDGEAGGFLVDSTAEADANDNVFRDNVANRNAGAGFLVHGHGNLVTGTVFDDNEANNNVFFGFGAFRAAADTWTDNVANHNGHWGIALFHPCTDNTVTDNTARNNGEFDLYDDDTPVLNTWVDNEFRTASTPTLD